MTSDSRQVVSLSSKTFSNNQLPYDVVSTLKEFVAEFIRQGLHGGTTVSVPSVSDGVMVDSAGLPVFRCEPASGRPRIDRATALQLEQQGLALEDLRRAGLSS